MKEILVTGGAGYIGSHLLRPLLEANYRPVVIDNLSNGFRDAVPADIVFYNVDIRDEEALREIFTKHDFSAVIHLAALAIVEESFSRADDYWDVNYYGLQSVLRCCREFGVQKFIFASSSTIYGDANAQEKLTESHHLDPISPYGKSKLLSEEWLEQQRHEWGLSYITLRFFNVAGACMQATNGQRGAGSQRLIYYITRAALTNIPLAIHGIDYRTQDGTCVRDYLHVEDAADIQLKALQYLETAPQNTGTTLNCGYGMGFSVREIVESYQKTNAVEFSVIASPRRHGDPAYLVGDNSRLTKLLGWASRFENPLEAICRSAYIWGLKTHSSRTGTK